MSKVAQVTLSFWIMKICATTLGETAGDLVSKTMGLGYGLSSAILISLFLISLVFQMRARAFHPTLFWLVILTTSTAGTTMSDFMDRTLELGYAKGSLILVTCLLAILAVWRFSQGTLSVSNIRTPTVELLYWITILISNTLGTALGDFLADDTGLGFVGGAALIGGLIAVIAILAYTTQLNRILLFWLAFILTRPFGATFGDFLTKPRNEGGLNFGTIGSSAVLAAILITLIILTGARTRRQARVRAGA